MKTYLDLVPITAKINRRNSRMTRICIFLAVLLITGIFSMADMQLRAQRVHTTYQNGCWHAAFNGITQEQAALIQARPEIKASSWYGVTNYRLDKGYTLEGTETVLCGLEEDFLKFFPATKIVEGSFPTQTDQVIATEGVRDHLNIQLGDSLNLITPQGESLSFTVCGFTGNTSMLTQQDAFGIFMGIDTYWKYFAADTEHLDSQFYVQFTPYCNIQKNISQIQSQFGLGEKQISQNTAILGMMFQSLDSYMVQLYLSVLILALLVVLAGALMIASSLNSSIARRTEFFGMLRCLGATPKQIRRFVRREAIGWCKTAIPAAVLFSVLICWILCAMLRFISPGLFAELPVFGVSWPSIIFGTILGIITVLAAAHAPAKKAAKVSPLTALSGNTFFDHFARRAANTRLLPVDVALGIHRAKGSRKNFFLITASFAFSIILFLSFTTVVDFLNHAFQPLKPYAPDLSIISPDSSCSIDPDLTKEIQKMPGVQRVFGRSFAYNLQAVSQGESVTVNLISYEEYQFQWAEEDMLIEGSVEDVAEGKGFLTVYSSSNPLKTGDCLTLDTLSGAMEFPISGTLSTSPFSREEGKEIIICSEKLFRQITGESNYTIVDVQLLRSATDSEVSDIRELGGEENQFSDRRMSNQETIGAYYSGSLFIYGFLAAIALISIFNIINCISMSVSAHIRQYGAMRAIGMSDLQLLRMVACETSAYGLSGIFFGCLIGLPLHWLLFREIVTSRWGTAWSIPVLPVAIILLITLFAILLAVLAPAKRIHNLSIVDTINDH